MVKMEKLGKVPITVPNSTQKIYEKLGYKVAGTAEVETEVEETAAAVEEQPEEVEDYTDKPIAKWTPTELKEYVIEHEVDLKGAKKTAEVREIVKAHLLEG